MTMSGDADAFDTTVLAESGPRPSRDSAHAALRRWVGARFDHFDVLEPLARGGMGAVYVGHDRSLDRRVAIKVLPDELANDPELFERFIREARAQARLNSPRVAHIYYIGRTPTQGDRPASLFFAMELVEGGALEAVGRVEAEAPRHHRAEPREAIVERREERRIGEPLLHPAHALPGQGTGPERPLAGGHDGAGMRVGGKLGVGLGMAELLYQQPVRRFPGHPARHGRR